jgi:hypothetical protein
VPFKDKKKAKEYQKSYHKKYDRERTILLHQAKIAQGIPIDKRKKPKKLD